MDDQPQFLGQPASSPRGDFVSLCLSFFLCFLFLGCAVFVIRYLYHPDTTLLLKEAEATLLPHLLSRCKPEPVEKLLFATAAVLTPLFLVCSMLGISKGFIRASQACQDVLYRLSLILVVAGSMLAGGLVYEALAQSNSFYIRTNFFYLYPVYYSCLFFPGLLVLLLTASTGRLRLGWRMLLYGSAATLSLALVFTMLWNCDTIHPWAHHMNPLLYPLAQVLQGKTLLVDCPSLYGLFPHILAPLFSFLPSSVYAFSLVMSLLFLAVLASIWFFLKKNTRNDLLLLVGFLAALFYGYLEPRILSKLIHIRPDPFFQYAPIRMLFPYALLALSVLYQTTRHKRTLYYLTSMLMALAVLWNFDSGIVAFCAWLLFLAYRELFHAPTYVQAIVPILKHLARSLLFLLLAVLGYSAFALLRCGTLPDWAGCFQFYAIFSAYGFFQMPMPTQLHLWMIVVALYIFALSISLQGLLKKEDELFHSSLFTLSIVGTGLFLYYQGRSHDVNLSPLLITPILIVTLLADATLEKVAQKNRAGYLFVPLSLLGLYFCAGAIPSICLWGPRLFHVWAVPGFQAVYQKPSGYNARNIEFIKRHTRPGEPIAIYSDLFIDGLYHAETRTRAAMDLPSSTDYFLKRDITTLYAFFETNKTQKVFVVPGKHPAALVTVFQTRYTCIDQDPRTGLQLLLPRP